MTNLQLLGATLLFAGIMLAAYDIVTNKLKSKIWLILLYFLFIVFGFFLLLKLQEFLIIATFLFLGSITWIWLETLYEKLNKKRIDVFKTFPSRLAVFLFSCALYLFFDFVLYPSMKIFLEHLKIFVNIPKLLSVIITFSVIYILTIFMFGLLYATLHTYLKYSGFKSAQELILQDFFFYSAFNIATQSYKDMSPSHWLISLLSLIQVLVGIALLGIYLAGAFTFIVSP